MNAQEFTALAKSNGWSRKRTRDELYKINDESLWAERDAICSALGFATTDQTAAAAQTAQQQAAAASAADSEARIAAGRERLQAERAEREAAERQAREEARAKRAAAKAAIVDGAVLWCDAAENRTTRVVNGYGKKRTFDNGGHRVAVVCGEFVTRHVNTVCPDQFAAECFAVLKAVELAVECGLKTCTIRNDRIGGFEASVKKGYAGAKYLWVAKKIANENGLAVTFDQCRGDENLADHASRTEG